MECSGVAEVAVVATPDAIKGLVPAALVTLRAGTPRSPESRNAIRRQVADVIGKITVPETCSSPMPCRGPRATRSCAGC